MPWYVAPISIVSPISLNTINRIHHIRNEPKFAQFIANAHVTGANSILLHTVVSEDITMADATVAPVSTEEPTLSSEMAAPRPEGLALLSQSEPTRPEESALSSHGPAAQLIESVDMDVDQESYEIEKIVDIDTTGVSITEFRMKLS